MKITFAFVLFCSVLAFLFLQVQQITTDSLIYIDKISLIGFMFVVIYNLVNYIKKKEELFVKKEERLNSLLIQIVLHAMSINGEKQDDKMKDLITKVEEINVNNK